MNQCILKLLPNFKNFSPEYVAEILSTSKIVESLQHQFEMEIVSYIILQIKSTKMALLFTFQALPVNHD